jgi:hypothetical protein
MPLAEQVSTDYRYSQHVNPNGVMQAFATQPRTFARMLAMHVGSLTRSHWLESGYRWDGAH